MAFVFDATPSGPNANSYVTVSEADDYFTVHLDNSFWPTTTPLKQSALVMATNRLEAEQYGGDITVSGQALQWPRRYIERRNMTVDGEISSSGEYYRDSTVTPKEVKQATFELALHYLKSQAGEYTVDENDLETLTKYKVGPLDVSIAGNVKADRLPTKVKRLLNSAGPNAWNGEGPLTYTR
jgi:hypothetical protein